MIIDLRVYTYVPSKFRKFLKGYEELGFALTSKHLGRTLGVFRPESGIQNRTFQFFMYENSPHRDVCRKGMLADPAWADFIKIDSDALLQQMNTLLIPTSFSPLRQPSDADRLTIDEHGSRLFELRSWTLRPETSQSAIQALADGDAQLLTRHASEVFGWFTADTGVDHRLFMLSSFPDALTRDRVRDMANADPEVQSARSRLRSHVVEEEAQLLLPLPYSPLR